MGRMGLLDHRFNLMLPRSPKALLESVANQESLWVAKSLV